MSNKRLAIFVAGVLVALALIVVVIGSLGRQGGGPPASEPERGGRPSIAIFNTEKLNAVLPPAQFFAVKDALNTYIQGRFGEDVSASIEDTILNVDGSVSLKVDVEGEQFEARAYQKNGGFYFEVPASHYQVHRSQTEVNDQYQGILNE